MCFEEEIRLPCSSSDHGKSHHQPRRRVRVGRQHSSRLDVLSSGCMSLDYRCYDGVPHFPQDSGLTSQGLLICLVSSPRLGGPRFSLLAHAVPSAYSPRSLCTCFFSFPLRRLETISSGAMDVRLQLRCVSALSHRHVLTNRNGRSLHF